MRQHYQHNTMQLHTKNSGHGRPVEGAKSVAEAYLRAALRLGRCDEEAVEEEVKKRSATEDAMGAKTLCHPFSSEGLPVRSPCLLTSLAAVNPIMESDVALPQL